MKLPPRACTAAAAGLLLLAAASCGQEARQPVQPEVERGLTTTAEATASTTSEVIQVCPLPLYELVPSEDPTFDLNRNGTVCEEVVLLTDDVPGRTDDVEIEGAAP